MIRFKLVCSSARYYLAAIVAVIVAALLTSFLNSYINSYVYAFFYAAVSISAWYGGTRAGILATVLAYGTLNWFFIPPLYSFELNDIGEIVRLSAFILVSILIGSLNANLKIANQRLQKNLQALKESEERYRVLTENIPQAVWFTNADGSVEYFNQRWYDYTGLSCIESIGWKWQQAVHPEDLPFVIADWIKALETEQPVEIQHRLRRSDGDYRWQITRVVPLHTSGGVIDRWFGSCTDIHEQKAIQQRLTHREQERNQLLTALESKQRLFEAVLRQMPAGLIVAEAPSGKLILANEQLERIWQQSLVGTDSIEQYQCFHRNGHLYTYHETPLARSLQTGEVVVDEEIAFLRGNGTQGVMLVNSAPVRNSQGDITAGVVTFFDITERKQAEAERNELLKREQIAREQAEKANRIKDEFLAVLSHELRSPLNPILGWAKLLRTRPADAQTTERALATIERNARLQTKLIDDLLDVSRILQGKLNLNISSVDLVSTIEEALETVRLAAEAKSLRIQTVLEDVGIMRGDSARLQQVVWNLLSNAVKFTPNGGCIEVRLSVYEGDKGGKEDVFHSHQSTVNHQSSTPNTRYAQIQVIDTGRGIKAEFLPHVFDYFRQADSSITRNFGGLGLGLAIVRQIVELHGGTVNAQSLGEGEGATFTVRLPVIAESTASKQGNRLSHQFLNLKGVKILAVDDEADTRDFITYTLEQAGADVVVVATANEALTAFAQAKPDILLLDIGMPNMDGYTLLRQMRTDKSAPALSQPSETKGVIPALALTAYARECDRELAIAAGFQSHLTKPVDPVELIQAISAIAGVDQV